MKTEGVEQKEAKEAQGVIHKPVRCCRCKHVHGEQDRILLPASDGVGEVSTCPKCKGHSFYKVRSDGKNVRNGDEWAEQIEKGERR